LWLVASELWSVAVLATSAPSGLKRTLKSGKHAADVVRLFQRDLGLLVRQQPETLRQKEERLRFSQGTASNSEEL